MQKELRDYEIQSLLELDIPYFGNLTETADQFLMEMEKNIRDICHVHLMNHG